MALEYPDWALAADGSEQAWDDPFTERREQRGASLVEAVAFLGTATIVAMNAASMLGNATTDANALSVAQDAVVIQAGVRALGMMRGGGANLDLSALAAAERLPASLQIEPDGTVLDRWGGQVALGPVPGNPGLFMLAYPNVPGPVCVNTLASAGDNWVAIGVADSDAGLVAPADMNARLAGEACAGGPQTLEWVSE
jgi:hypothetical protein